MLVFSMTKIFALSGADVTVSRVTAPRFTLDHNKPCEEGPSASYIGIEVTNVSGSTLRNISVKLTGLSSSSSRVENLSDSTRLIGTMNNGQSKTAYFYIKYPCSSSTNVNFTFEVSDNRSGVVTYNTTVSTYNMISANAGGKVDARSTGVSSTLGGLICDTITYSFGNIQVGDEIEFQPAGDSLFNPKGLVLLNCKVIDSDIPVNVAVGTEDRMYYISTKKYNGTGHKVKVVFYFVNKMTGSATDLSPFASLTSGTQLKYTADFGTGKGLATISPVSNTSPFNVERSIDKEVASIGDTVVFTVDIINTSSETLMFDKIVETLDTGYAFVAIEPQSEITSTQSIDEPTTNDVYQLEFVGGVEESSYPYQTYTVQPSDTVTLVYSATVPTTTSTVDVTETTVLVGTETGGVDQSTSCVGCGALPVELVSFTAERDGDIGLLSWVTASELNSSHFVVNRSDASGLFEPLGSVEAAHFSQTREAYSFVDFDFSSVAIPVVMYRLDQVDLDGKVTSYFTQIEQFTDETGGFIVSPNPTDGKLLIEAPVWYGQALQLEVYSSMGEQVISSVWNVGQTTEVSMEDLSPGLYTLTIIEGSRAYNFKIHKL